MHPQILRRSFRQSLSLKSASARCMHKEKRHASHELQARNRTIADDGPAPADNTLCVMKHRVLAPIAFLVVVSAVAFASQPAANAATLIAAARPDVRWDMETLAEGDFNGDGRSDYAMVGYRSNGLVLAVRASAGKGRAYRNDFQNFGVGPSIQAAICEAPAKLTVGEQFCRPMDEPLPGCRPSKAANSLNLSGGDCDSIHLFWNHKTNRMEWWRL